MPIIRPCILNINKPLGWTSRDVLNKLQGLYNFKKFGHAGTLDPLATGVLIVLAADMTKKQDYFMGLDKIYRTKIFFGLNSPTNDLEGPFDIDENFENIELSEEEIAMYLESILGVVEQKVPFYSAVKVDGKELYKHARTGQDIKKLPVKEVELKTFSILNSQFSKTEEVPKNIVEKLNEEKEYSNKLKLIEKYFPSIELTLTTGKGFYVRSLARDLGKTFKTKAVMGSLIRQAVGEYKVEDAKDLSYFEDAPDLV